ncbi:hypothetical protein [Streptomonospora salina]|uniref:Alkyl sulfatase BDS1-like metallo-beta-lactamase superfamily hydrolase n=1 Tax=Streptomonospora salina TaxID=104205 RepID=A0A841E8K3_9ACTN|nr:hypothetical protein [Streptomonospora salina]MBB5998814.1 alkyl sulfatase BDS1-like metallo-beta-lactamase superfamily hydrolase [Streptomonospora salina]
MALPSFSDRSDFDDAGRGFVTSLDSAVITAADGTTVRDGGAYGFLDGECPESTTSPCAASTAI